jgi:hypothetical protein
VVGEIGSWDKESADLFDLFVLLSRGKADCSGAAVPYKPNEFLFVAEFGIFLGVGLDA